MKEEDLFAGRDDYVLDPKRVAVDKVFDICAE